MKRLLVLSALTLLPSIAQAQSCANCVYTTSGSGQLTVSSCCTQAPSEETMAKWAAAKAIEIQLNWFDEKKIKEADRATIDALQVRVDELCKWAKTLSNHIFSSAYLEWGKKATAIIEERRLFLDKMEVVKSLVIGLPIPPESK